MMIIRTNKATIISVAIAVIMSACNNNSNTAAGNKTHADSSTVTVYTFQVGQGYGYAIFVNGKEFINQNCIPVIQGNKPFVSRQQAGKTGKFVAQKLRNKQLPALTLEDLDKLDITQQ